MLLLQMFEKVNNQGFGYVYLMDGDGQIIYHPKQKAVYSGIVKENNLVHATYQDKEYNEVYDEDGVYVGKKMKPDRNGDISLEGFERYVKERIFGHDKEIETIYSARE